MLMGWDAITRYLVYHPFINHDDRGVHVWARCLVDYIGESGVMPDRG